MRNQSERQLGAYVLLYFSVLERSPETVFQKDIELRNNVIHKGVFPTYEETYHYAERTFDYIKTKLIELKENMNDSVEYVHEKILRKTISEENEKVIVNW